MPDHDTSNRYRVVRYGDRLRIRSSAMATGPLTPVQALNLAAWLVALANPPPGMFEAMVMMITAPEPGPLARAAATPAILAGQLVSWTAQAVAEARRPHSRLRPRSIKGLRSANQVVRSLAAGDIHGARRSAEEAAAEDATWRRLYTLVSELAAAAALE